MSKKKTRQNLQKKYYDVKSQMMLYAKRFAIIIAFSAVISMIFCYVMTEEVPGFTSVLAVISTLGIVLACTLVGLIIFNKLDDKEEEKLKTQDQRDPFCD